jgi:hypothetical protein
MRTLCFCQQNAQSVQNQFLNQEKKKKYIFHNIHKRILDKQMNDKYKIKVLFHNLTHILGKNVETSD